MGRIPTAVNRTISSPVTALIIVALLATPYVSASDVFYRDIAVEENSGIQYGRVPSDTLANAEAIQEMGTVTMADFIGHHPIKPHGAPGVALLDFDGDGDLDIYATNGPGAANSLFASQLADSGELRFVDVATAAGVGAVDQDSAGVCFGDIDNDADPDLYVLGRSEPNRLFENRGDGTFADITASAGVGGGDLSSVSCSMADVDRDGLLDIVVANGFDMASSLAIFLEPFALNEHNQLFVNTGGNVFADLSDASGVGAAQDITWATAMVDIDQDGDADILTANDNGGIPFAEMGGIDRGFVRLLVNDGTGRFDDLTAERGLRSPGDWMGLSFGDLDHNGTLDVFASNSGDYFEAFFGLPVSVGDQATRWYLQNPDGSFADPGVGELVATPFGWGTAAFDADNDGDTDLLSFGGLDAGPLVDCSNPGTLLLNDGNAHFTLDEDAFSRGGADHANRIEHGVAVGDLDQDGFTDIVSISAIDLPTPPAPVVSIPYPITYGSIFDGEAKFFPTFLPGDEPGEMVFSGAEFHRGTVAVELAEGNGNGSAEIATLGTVGLTSGGTVNRDGIGAVLRFTPEGGRTAIQPVLGGSSYASQNALARVFGLGEARRGTVEVLWPGGTVNRLYNVRAGERIVLPEIPCSIDDTSLSRREYTACVRGALDELVAAGALEPDQRARFQASALRAFAEERSGR